MLWKKGGHWPIFVVAPSYESFTSSLTLQLRAVADDMGVEAAYRL